MLQFWLEKINFKDLSGLSSLESSVNRTYGMLDSPFTIHDCQSGPSIHIFI